jgi:hypothetical protein
MPLGPDVRYRYKKGSDVRLAFKGNEVVEAKNMETGDTHTSSEFASEAHRRHHAKRALKAEHCKVCMKGKK